MQMLARRFAAVISPVLSFVQWLFSELAPGVDLFLGLLGTGWLVLMIGRPALFDEGNFRGMMWAPDQAWIAFLALTTCLHVFGLLHLHAVNVRAGAMLLTSWYWLLVALSFARVGPSTGIVAYGLVGLASLASALYVSGRRRPVS